jgi:hypothetical protein
MELIDRAQARRIAAEYLKEGQTTDEGWTPVIVDAQTIETEFGWIFFYQSEEFLNTGESERQLAGNAPLIVDRRDGSLHVTGTAKPLKEYIREYKRRRGE